jgi:hypothetical protein
MNQQSGDLPATKNDLQLLARDIELARKRDLQELKHDILTSRKDNLQELKNDILSSRKQDIKEAVAHLATKEELKRAVAQLATKEELHAVEKRLDTRLTRVELAVVDIRAEMKTFETKEDADKKFKILVGMIEGLAARLDTAKTERAAILHALYRYDVKLENHEMRISKLES